MPAAGLRGVPALATFASCIALAACEAPALLHCGNGAVRRDGKVYACVYQSDAPATCPGPAPHRMLYGSAVLCATDVPVSAALCHGLPGCGSSQDGGAEAGVPDSGPPTADAGSGDAGASDGGPPPVSCGTDADCTGGAKCESWGGIQRCYLPCGTDITVDGGTKTVRDNSRCAGVGNGSRCAERDSGLFRCSIPCDVFDATSCGGGRGCDFHSDYAGGEVFTECRTAGSGGLGAPCPSATYTLCQQGFTCAFTTGGGYACTPLCDPSQTGVCPSAASTCTALPRPDPATSRAVGFCTTP